MASTFEERLDRYGDLLLRVGLNLQPGQKLVISGAQAGDPRVAEFVRATAHKAYDIGAADVVVFWGDPLLDRIRVDRASMEALGEPPTWRVKWLEDLSQQGAAFLNLYAPDPAQFKGADQQRLQTVLRTAQQALRAFSEAAGRMEHAWLVASIATPAWAQVVYPELAEDEAVAALWANIFSATRIDTPDPVAAWNTHLDELKRHTDQLNRAHFARLHYRAPGTELTIGLPQRHLWESGDSGVQSKRGVTFVPNLPTEETFTMPQRDGVEGTVRATMPLNYNGQLITGLWATFQGGRIVEYGADEGLDALKSIIETDEGSHYLGEVALVPHGSPSSFDRPLYNTLFDENAACHVAIGRAYPTNLQGGDAMTPEQLAEAGANDSLTHVDFMIGSDQLDIDGETEAGERIAVFRGGQWASGPGSLDAL
ncbi:MAG TPA: aminopeptidase [Ktedonobacterales bacterium]